MLFRFSFIPTKFAADPRNNTKLIIIFIDFSFRSTLLILKTFLKKILFLFGHFEWIPINIRGLIINKSTLYFRIPDIYSGTSYSVYGSRILLIRDSLYRLVFYTSNFEPHDSKILFKMFNNISGTFIDVGANFGWYSLLLHQSANPNSKIYAFEPSKLNFSLLKQNVKLNLISNIHPVKSGLGNGNDQAKLQIYSGKNLGEMSIADLKGKIGNFETVPIITLDEFVNKNFIKDIIFIKIDVEGYELKVLKGSTETIRRFSPVLLIEANWETSRAMGYDPVEMLNYLDELELGYKFYISHRFLSTLRELKILKGNQIRGGNVFCIVSKK